MIEIIAQTPLEDIQQYPQFFTEAFEWGLTAGMRVLAYCTGLSLLIYMFKT